MSIEEKIFLKSSVNFESLLEYGFKKNNDKYIYSKNILNDTFKVIVEISDDQNIKGKIFELEFEEEYTNYRINDFIGDFNGKIREEYENILKDIKEKCFIERYFISKQANRISDLIVEKYNNKPEFLWEKDSTSGVFRNSNNGKWYGIIMNISKDKIEKGNEKVEIINVKVDTKFIKDVLLQRGFYEAYHMNKKNWVSIILDDSIKDDIIMKYVSDSYILIDK